MHVGLNGCLGPSRKLSGLCWVMDTVSNLYVLNRDAAAVSPENQATPQTGGGVWKDRNPSSFDPTMLALSLYLISCFRSYVLRGGFSDVRKQTSANGNPLGRMLTHKYTFLILQAVSRKHHRSLFTSSSKITGSDRPWCSNVRNFPFHFRFIAEDCQKGGNINSRLPSGPRIHQSFVTW